MATATPQSHGWALLLLWGLSWVILGLLLLFRPGITAILLVQFMAVFWVVGGVIVTIAFQYYLLAFAAMVIGVINLFGGFKPNLSWGGSLLGLVQIILGIFLVTHPLVGMMAFVPTLGCIVIAGGIVTIVAAFRVKGAMAAAA